MHVGLGDPSGKGLAMSYLKNMKRLGKDPVNRMLGKQEGAASIMGTTSDLRKLPNKQVSPDNSMMLGLELFRFPVSDSPFRPRLYEKKVKM
jgi:acetate kinase